MKLIKNDTLSSYKNMVKVIIVNHLSTVSPKKKKIITQGMT